MVLVWELLKLVWGSLSLKMNLALFFQKMCGGSVRPRPPKRRERSLVSPQLIRSHFDVVVRVDAEVRLCTGFHTPHTPWVVNGLAKASIPHLVHGSEVSLPRPSHHSIHSACVQGPCRFDMATTRSQRTPARLSKRLEQKWLRL